METVVLFSVPNKFNDLYSRKHFCFGATTATLVQPFLFIASHLCSAFYRYMFVNLQPVFLRMFVTNFYFAIKLSGRGFRCPEGWHLSLSMNSTFSMCNNVHKLSSRYTQRNVLTVRLIDLSTQNFNLQKMKYGILSASTMIH